MLTKGSTPTNEEAFIDSIKAYVARPNSQGFDENAYAVAVAHYIPQVRKIFEDFFEAIQAYISNKDEQSLAKGVGEFIKFGAADSSSPYAWVLRIWSS